MIAQDIERREKKSDKIRPTPSPCDVADRVSAYVQGYFTVGQSLLNPVNIRFSKPQPISHQQADPVPTGYYCYTYILKNAYKYKISITIDHDPLKTEMAEKWDISYEVRRYRQKLSLFDRLLGEKSYYSKYIKGDYLKTIDTTHASEDELIAELSVSTIYLLEDIIKRYINGIFSRNTKPENTVNTVLETAHTRIRDKLGSMGLPSIFRHRLSFNQGKS